MTPEASRIWAQKKSQARGRIEGRAGRRRELAAKQKKQAAYVREWRRGKAAVRKLETEEERAQRRPETRALAKETGNYHRAWETILQGALETEEQRIERLEPLRNPLLAARAAEQAALDRAIEAEQAAIQAAVASDKNTDSREVELIKTSFNTSLSLHNRLTTLTHCASSRDTAVWFRKWIYLTLNSTILKPYSRTGNRDLVSDNA